MTLRPMVWRLTERLLARRLPARALDAVLGDLEDDYARMRAERGRLRAVVWLWREARSVARSYRKETPMRQARGNGWRHLGADARQSFRLLARSPGYVATVVLGLGAGLAVSIAMVSVLNAIFHGNAPGIADRASLARVVTHLSSDAERGRTRRPVLSLDQVALVREQAPDDVRVAGMGLSRLPVRAGDAGTLADTRFVTSGFFDVIGAAAVAGRMLVADDHGPDASAVVIGHRLWQDWFDGRPDALGQTILVGDQAMRVVGVAPDRFHGAGSWGVQQADEVPQLWLPAESAARWPGTPGPGDPWFTPYAQMAAGMTRDEAAAMLAPAAAALAADAGGDTRAVIAVNDPYLNDFADDPVNVAALLAVFLGGPLCLLAIGCANVANLRLARSASRARELALRVSLGATRGQLLRLLALETAVLTAGALVVGVIGATAPTRRFATLIVGLPVTIDARVLAWAILLAAIVMALSGLAPALLTVRRSTAAALRHTAGAGGAPHSHLRNTLVVVQIAVSVVLLAGSALFGRSMLLSASAVPTGFDRIVVADLGVADLSWSTDRRAAVTAALEQRLAGDPRVEAAGIAAFDLLSGESIDLEVEDAAGERRALIRRNPVTPGWLDAVGVDVVAGRSLGTGDPATSAVLNEAAARQLFGAATTVGRSLRVLRYSEAGWTRAGTLEIVGVVRDRIPDPRLVREWRSFVYTPFVGEVRDGFSVAVRTSRPDELVAMLSRDPSLGDEGLAASNVRTADAHVAEAGSWPVIAQLATAFGTLGAAALALAAVGLFAVLAYAVSMRQREIGIRMALGARVGDVTRLVLWQAVRLATIGLVAGFALALPAAYLIRGIFLGVSPFDPRALAPAVAVLLVTAIGAGVLPALRAARVDPVKTLRAE